MKVRVPASTTNFGSGFDTFGLALDLYNTFEFEVSDRYWVEIRGYGDDLPRDENNLVIRVYRHACRKLGLEEVPFRLFQENAVPTARGLGSSATAIVGGLEICRLIHGKDVPLGKRIEIAMEFEPHPDNLIPAMVGGFVICAGDSTPFVRFGFPEDLRLALAVPEFKLPTEKARSVLRTEVPLRDCVFNIRRASLLVYAIMSGEYDLLRTAVEDRIHQPYRSRMVPGFEEAVRSGYGAGAYGVFLSGAGPSVCAVCPKERAEDVGEAMVLAFRKHGVRAEALVLKASEKGVHTL
ncbi:MAG: homoserine kinase [Aquificota bacterium]|nr:homoserine kinase [Aquificota bacterium]